MAVGVFFIGKEDTPMEKMTQMSAKRWSIEHLYRLAPSYDTGIFNHAFFTERALRVWSKNNIWTLPQAKRLLLAALAEESLTVEKAIAIAYYHLRRNETARLSHWKRKQVLLL